MSGNIICSLGLLMVLIIFEAGDVTGTTAKSFGRVLDSFQRDCSCGQRNSVASRIVGGSETGVNEYPMMAAFVDNRNNQLFCGATIISNKHVLTAAHCLVSEISPPTNFAAVWVGYHNLETETSASKRYKVERYDVHAYYNESRTSENDIAVITVEGTIEFSNVAGPACLPFRHRNDDFEGLNLDVLGWGSTYFAGPTSNVLLKTSLAVTNLAACKAVYPTGDINYRHLCMYTAGKDTCQFDSGGPVLWQNPGSGRIVLLGITSAGKNCGGDNPSISIRVGAYIDWITDITGAQFCQAE